MLLLLYISCSPHSLCLCCSGPSFHLALPFVDTQTGGQRSPNQHNAWRCPKPCSGMHKDLLSWLKKLNTSEFALKNHQNLIQDHKFSVKNSLNMNLVIQKFRTFLDSNLGSQNQKVKYSCSSASIEKFRKSVPKCRSLTSRCYKFSSQSLSIC